MYRETQTLTVTYEEPGFFINDTPLEVDLDGHRIYEGSFKTGFHHEARISEGMHELVTRISLGVIMRVKRYTFTIGKAPAYTARLKYSRIWGNFTGKLDLFEDANRPPAR